MSWRPLSNVSWGREYEHAVTATLIATGGTLAWSDEEQRMLSGHELTRASGVSFGSILDVESLPSWDLAVTDMEVIAKAVCKAVDGGATAVVVAHGTDTLEETAWLTDLYLGDRRTVASVVFTGSMRFADHAEPDGPSNLRQAAELAESTAGQGHGVQVSFAGQVHAARWIRKSRVDGLAVFDSAGRPPVAPPPPASAEAIEPKVAVLKIGGMVRPELPSSTRGLVAEGTGACHVPSAFHAPLRQLAESGTPVVLASRAHDKPRPARSAPWLYACDLTAEKAAVALMIGLASTKTPDALEAWWDDLMAAAVFAPTDAG